MCKQCDLERVRAGDTRATRSLLLPRWKAVTWDKHKLNFSGEFSGEFISDQSGHGVHGCDTARERANMWL